MNSKKIKAISNKGICMKCLKNKQHIHIILLIEVLEVYMIVVIQNFNVVMNVIR